MEQQLEELEAKLAQKEQTCTGLQKELFVLQNQLKSQSLKEENTTQQLQQIEAERRLKLKQLELDQKGEVIKALQLEK